MKVPCELIVWYIIPVIRREFAKILVEDFNLTQREAAKKLGLTESAVSQYLKSKRGGGMKLNKKIVDEIKKMTKEIAESEKDYLMIEKTCSVCTLIKDSGFLCKLHRESNTKLRGCKVCIG